MGEEEIVGRMLYRCTQVRHKSLQVLFLLPLLPALYEEHNILIPFDNFI